MAGLKYFMKVWRTELPWIKRRPTAGPFTHCGLCDYLKWTMANSSDKGVREQLASVLGEHFQFQAAQRVAMSQIFRESEEHPEDLVAVAWDKMDQAKTIVPRIVALSNTQFMKGGSRLVVSLIGVLAPALFKQPLVYTILEDQVHGGDMIASMMVDFLQEAVAIKGMLPRRLFIQADNTVKETKNTISLFGAAWLLAQLRGTRLHCIEFGYLVVGHTRDLMDAMFAYISKALAGRDFYRLEEMMALLQSIMKSPPFWKHLRDVYAFNEAQPEKLGSKRVKGITQPNNVRVFWGTDGSILVQSKHWLTSPEWGEAMVLVEQSEVQALSQLYPNIVQPAWEEGFVRKSEAWFGKLRDLFLRLVWQFVCLFPVLLELGIFHHFSLTCPIWPRLAAADRRSDGVDQCLALLRHQNDAFLPSGQSLGDRIMAIRRLADAGGHCQPTASAGFSEELRRVMAAAFPKCSASIRDGKSGLLTLPGAQASDNQGFCQDELEAGTLAIFCLQQAY